MRDGLMKGTEPWFLSRETVRKHSTEECPSELSVPWHLRGSAGPPAVNPLPEFQEMTLIAVARTVIAAGE